MNSIKVSVFVGISVDGFMARGDHALDFLPEEPEDHGYEAFIATVDTLVIGRNTYDKVLSFGDWHYGDKRVVVLSSRPLTMPDSAESNVAQMTGDPASIMASLAARGARHVYVDGGQTVQRFLRAGLIDRLIITRVPVLIGEGISLFGELSHDIRLQHVATRSFASGLVQSEYTILKTTAP